MGEGMEARYTLLTHFSQRYPKIPQFDSENKATVIGVCCPSRLNCSVAEVLACTSGLVRRGLRRVMMTRRLNIFNKKWNSSNKMGMTALEYWHAPLHGQLMTVSSVSSPMFERSTHTTRLRKWQPTSLLISTLNSRAEQIMKQRWLQTEKEMSWTPAPGDPVTGTEESPRLHIRLPYHQSLAITRPARCCQSTATRVDGTSTDTALQDHREISA